ncbi:MAG TPA: response regulator [Nitrososphaeraceae archaeon]|jgi:DNA-binding NtrC family response regulator|nr:response regulator [Nitrososphaeraceae archaeon]
MVTKTKSYTIMILDDEEDILKLYGDFLTSRGHRVLKTYVNADTILDDIDIEPPDVYLIDYRLLGNMNGVEVAIEILNKFPTACIIFITAFELVRQEILRRDIFTDKNIDVLIKPVKLYNILNSMISIINKKGLAYVK